MKAIFRSFLTGFLIGSALFLVAARADAAPGNAMRGATLYEDKCTGCHSLDANRIGPAHRGVFGRKAGSAKGFAYSPAVKRSKIVWNEATLDKWLSNPGATIPGSRMGFQLANPEQRADVIAFLKRESGQKR